MTDDLKVEVHWKQECPHGGVEYPKNFDDYADPFGDCSFELWTFKMGDHWNWEVDYPQGHCGGEASTQELARKHADSIFRALMSLTDPAPEGATVDNRKAPGA